MSLTTRKREAYIWVEKRVTNLGGLYLGELIHQGGGGGGLFTEFNGDNIILKSTKKNCKKPLTISVKTFHQRCLAMS